MQFSQKIKWLLLISLGVVLLAIAASEGNKQSEREMAKRETPIKIEYPSVPLDIDPSAIDPDLDSANVKIPADIPKLPVAKVPVKIPVPGAITAEAYLVANLDTGEIYSEHNSRKVFPIASLSKLVTALVVLHTVPPDRKVTVTQPMLDAHGDAGHLVLGETLTVSELMYPLLLESSNDAAEALAQSHGYAGFITKMNSFTRELGMTSTYFRDASGLSSGNTSNAHDLFILSQYIYSTEKPLLEMTRQLTISVASTTEHGAHTWNTINPFPLDPHFMGGKTGRTTEAKESMISLFRYVHGNISYPVAIIVLRSDLRAREIDSSLLFEKFIQKMGWM